MFVFFLCISSSKGCTPQDEGAIRHPLKKALFYARQYTFCLCDTRNKRINLYIYIRLTQKKHMFERWDEFCAKHRYDRANSVSGSRQQVPCFAGAVRYTQKITVFGGAAWGSVCLCSCLCVCVHFGVCGTWIQPRRKPKIKTTKNVTGLVV